MDKKKIFIITSVSIVVISLILLLIFIVNKKPNEKIIENETMPEIELENEEEEIIDIQPEVIQSNDKSGITQEKLEKSESIFEKIIENEDYQTKIQEGDTLIDITFKNVGTITFKMYQKTAPNSVKWFLSLIKNNTVIKDETLTDEHVKWSFLTTDREFYHDEISSELFPIKGVLYQKRVSSNKFFICNKELTLTDLDKNTFTKPVIDYFQKYNGDFSIYNDVTLIGQAVNNIDLIDKLNDGFIIESIKIRE